MEFISPSRQLRPPMPQSRRNRSDFGRYTFFWPEMNIHNLCYKLLLASFPGSEAKLKRPLRCISLIRSYERRFPRKVHHKRIEILAVRCLGSPPTKVGRSLENDCKSVYSFPHKLNIVSDGSELRSENEARILYTLESSHFTVLLLYGELAQQLVCDFQP